MAEDLSHLLERVRRDEPPAVAEWVARFGPSGQRLAQALLRDSHDAEEAVQEAFVTALAQLGELRSAEAFPAWFRQIVRTCAGRISRRRRPDPRIDELAPIDHRALRPDESAQRAELRDCVRRALAQLRSPQRETAEMFYLEEQSVADVAAALDVPIGTVKRRLHGARAQLRRLLLGSHSPPSRRDDAI